MPGSSFEFEKKPFFATPDPDCFVPLTVYSEALDALRNWAQDGEGIALVTSPSGLGKTLLCERLAQELSQEFVSVFLPHADYPTVRQLMQTILFQLQRPYAKLDDNELRLEIWETLKQIESSGRRMLLMIDEAHELSEDMLRELKTLVTIQGKNADGILLLLSGQLELEELLTRRNLSAINQRVKLHQVLESLTRDESAEYLAARLEWAGADIETVMDENAVALITHLCDGVPRCLNVLAEESIKQAAFLGESLVTENIVRESFELVRHLPLHWNELPEIASLSECDDEDDVVLDTPQSRDSKAPPEPKPSPAEFAREPGEYVVAEFGAGIDDESTVVRMISDQPPAKGSDDDDFSLSNDVVVAGEAVPEEKPVPPQPVPFIPKASFEADEFGHGLRDVFGEFSDDEKSSNDVEDLIGEVVEPARSETSARPVAEQKRPKFRADRPHSRLNPVDIFAPDVPPVKQMEQFAPPVAEEPRVVEPVAVEPAVAPPVEDLEDESLIDLQDEIEELVETASIVRDDEPIWDEVTIAAAVEEIASQAHAYDVIEPRERPVHEPARSQHELHLPVHQPRQRYRNLFRELRRRRME